MRISSLKRTGPGRLSQKRGKCLLVCALGTAALAAAGAEAISGTLARIALLSDPHVLAATNKEHAVYRAHFEQAIAEVNAAGADLVLIAGDLTNHGKREEIEEFKKRIHGFKAPVWFVYGNHDVGNEPTAGKPSFVTADSVALFEKELGLSYFDRTCSGVRVVGLNSSLLGSGLPEEAKMWEFLEAHLAKRDRAPLLMLSHNPPFLKSADEPADYFNIGPQARSRLLGMLPKGAVPAFLSGHLHHSLVNHLDGRLFLTTPPLSFSLPSGTDKEGWTLVTVTATGEVQYAFKFLKK